MNLRLSVFIACVVGFVSISMEIVWFSVIGYLLRGQAGIFGIVLSLVLFGIAFGAKYGYKKVKLGSENITSLISKFLLLTGIINFLAFPLIGWLMTIHEYFAILFIFKIIVISFLVGSIFPLLCHISIPQDEESVGQHTSWIYAGNIVGATTGPLFTGFVLIDHFEISYIITALCAVCILLSILLKWNELGVSFLYSKKSVFMLLSLIIMTACFKDLYSNHYELIHFKTNYNNQKFKYIAENKSGIITVEEDKKGDIFYGGGAYDGRVNIDPENNSNGIDRTYLVAALHPNPEDVLMIGLSTGSWARILSDYSKIKSLTIIEINSNYVELIEKYPEVNTILGDDKVSIIIDDGRRWLRRNTDKKFDLVVMNTTFHFREHITNLVSFEFLKMCQQRLKKDGVMYWNTTHCPDIIYTASNVFSNVTTFKGFVAASDNPFTLDEETKRLSFLEFKRNGSSIFLKNDKTIRLMNRLISAPLDNIRDSILDQNLWLITDDNMASEYKEGVWHKN